MFSFLWRWRILDLIKGSDRVDRISDLPDELILEILSNLSMKDVVSTMILSKRWKLLWMYVPRLEYDHNMYQRGENRRFSRFINTSLKLHKAWDIGSLNMKFGKKAKANDIGGFVKTATKRSVRELCIKIDTLSTRKMDQVKLPSHLFKGCKMLVRLLLENLILTESLSPVSFPSLKTLLLISVKYPSEEFVSDFLSSCPVLETLLVERCPRDNVVTFPVIVTSLKVLLLSQSRDRDAQQFWIDTPSLELLEVKTEKAPSTINVTTVHVTCNHTKQILSSLTSLEQLGLCLMTSKDAYPEGIIFSRLVRLQLCTSESEWLKLLLCLLKDSPKLKDLRLERLYPRQTKYSKPSWNEPSHVPGCLLSSLETFEWLEYEGREEDIQVARFILRNSRRLKKANFYPEYTDVAQKLEISLMEFSKSPCKVLFSRFF